MLKEGDLAPDFNLNDGKGQNIWLHDFKGKNVVLYFYPKDNTSGCTMEACNFRDSFPQFGEINAVIIGVSGDSEKSHQNFASKYDLPFILLSDPEKKVLEQYGVWKEKSMYGKKYMGIERTTFIIGAEGKILKIYPKVKVQGHVEEILQFLQN